MYELLKVSRADFIVSHYGMRKYLTSEEYQDDWAHLTAIQRFIKVKQETHWDLGLLFHGELAWEVQVIWFVFMFFYE